MFRHTLYGLTIVLMALAMTSPSASAAGLGYFEDFESVELGDYISQQTDWHEAHYGENVPIVTDAQAFSGTKSITSNAGNTGMIIDFEEPLVDDGLTFSFMWYKEDWGPGGEDDRVRLDLWASMSKYAGTLVIWNGEAKNDQNLSEVAVSGLQLSTWYRCDVMLTRTEADDMYEREATVSVFAADGTPVGSGPLTMGMGSREVPVEIARIDISYRPDVGIHIDDFSISAIQPECEPGDADKDGDVDDDDLSLLLANWGETVTCTKGEFSGTAPVNDDDLSLLLANWTGPLVAAVPEPATLGLIAVGGLALLRRKR